MKMFKKLLESRKAYADEVKVNLPKINPELVESIELLSIKKDVSDAFLKQEKRDQIIRFYNKSLFAQRMKPVLSEDQARLMDIQLRIQFLNGNRLIIWPSGEIVDELVVSYIKDKREYLKYLDSYNLSSLLSREYEAM